MKFNSAIIKATVALSVAVITEGQLRGSSPRSLEEDDLTKLNDTSNYNTLLQTIFADLLPPEAYNLDELKTLNPVSSINLNQASLINSAPNSAASNVADELEIDILLDMQTELDSLNKAVKKQAKKTTSKSQADMLARGSQAIVDVVSSIEQCSSDPDLTCDVDTWINVISSTIFTIGPVITKACPKCGIALYTVATVGKIISILTGGGPALEDNEQYPAPLTMRDIEAAVTNAIGRVNHWSTLSDLRVLDTVMERRANDWGQIVSVMIPILRSNPSICELERVDDCINLAIDNWYSSSFSAERDSLTTATGAMNTVAVTAFQNAFGSQNSYRSAYKDWMNGCSNNNECTFHHGNTGNNNMISRGNNRNNFNNCVMNVEDAKERIKQMEEVYTELINAFFRYNALASTSLRIFSEYEGCSVQDFEEVALNNGLPLAGNNRCIKYARAVHDLMLEQERFDLYIYDLNSIYMPGFNDEIEGNDDIQCEEEGHPLYQSCDNPNDSRGCNYGNVVTVSRNDQQSRGVFAGGHGVRLFQTEGASSIAQNRCEEVLQTNQCDKSTNWCPFSSSLTSFGGPANRYANPAPMIKQMYSYTSSGNNLRPIRVVSPNLRPLYFCQDMVNNVQRNGHHSNPFLGRQCNNNRNVNCQIQMWAFPNTCPVQNEESKCHKHYLDDSLFVTH